MRNSNIISNKEYANILSGQTFWYITVDVNMVFKVESECYVGRKERTSDGSFSFSRKWLYTDGVFYRYPKLANLYEVRKFWTKKAAERWLSYNQYKIMPGATNTGILSVVKRVRKPAVIASN